MTALAGLTPRQKQVLQCIKDFNKAHGCPPTVRELGTLIGVTSPNGVMCHMWALKRKGFVRWEPGKARTIRLVAKGDAKEMQASYKRAKQIAKPSGHLSIRINKAYQRALKLKAAYHGLSLNQYCVSLLEKELDQ